MNEPDWFPDAPITIGTTLHEFPPLEREAAPRPAEHGHLVALAWVFDRARTSILLVDHRSMMWSCPGGHIEVGELPLDAARRELHEETGLTTQPITSVPFVLARTIGCRRFGPDTVHWAVGYAFVADPATTISAETGQHAHWFDIEHLPSARADDIDTVITYTTPADRPSRH